MLTGVTIWLDVVWHFNSTGLEGCILKRRGVQTAESVTTQSRLVAASQPFVVFPLVFCFLVRLCCNTCWHTCKVCRNNMMYWIAINQKSGCNKVIQSNQENKSHPFSWLVGPALNGTLVLKLTRPQLSTEINKHGLIRQVVQCCIQLL